MNRRTLIKGAGAGLGLAAIATPAHAANALQTMLGRAGLFARPTKTPIKHLVVVMMENRSADHYLGWYNRENPDFDARQHVEYRDLRKGPHGPTISTQNWGIGGLNSMHGRGFADPDHGWDGGRAERAGGSLAGWLDPSTGNDEFSLAYYDAVDVPVWAQLVRKYQTYDRWHCSLLGPTQPNRFYMHSAQSGGRKNNDLPPQAAAEGHPEWQLGWDWPTIWTLLDKAGISSAYYGSNLPVLAYWGARHVGSIRHISEYYARAETGSLPSVSFIDPFFTISDDFGNDDHPHADLRLGQAFISDVVEAWTGSPNYREGAMVLTYDEWGGFFEHVAPPRIADDRGTPKDPGGANDFSQIGFRIPSTIISPWTRNAGAVDHTTYEHSSVVRFIQDNWGLPNLTLRSKSTNSIEHAFGGFRTRNDTVDFVPYHAKLASVVNSAWGAVSEELASEIGDPTSPPGVPFSAPSPARPVTEGSSLQELRDMGWMDKFKIRTDWKLADSFLHSRKDLIAQTRLPVLL